MAYFYKDIRLIESKQISMALKSIYGVGLSKGLILCEASGIGLSTILSALPKHRFYVLTFLVKRFGLTEVNLQRFRHSKFKSFNSLMTYKSFKMRNGLPVRGQSTRTNARTSRRMRKG